MSTSLAFSNVVMVGAVIVGVLAGVFVWQQTRDRQAAVTPTPVVAEQGASTVAGLQSTPTASPPGEGTTHRLSVAPSPSWVPISLISPRPTPTPRRVATPRPTPTPTPAVAAATSSSLRVVWVDLPSAVDSGEQFTVRWRIEGPAGTRGDKTTLTVKYETAQNSGNSSSSTSSNTSNSFGSFTIPATFDSQFSFGGAPATIHLRATAEVGGKEYATTADIPLR